MFRFSFIESLPLVEKKIENTKNVANKIILFRFYVEKHMHVNYNNVIVNISFST